MKFAFKVVKLDSKIIISVHYSKSVTHTLYELQMLTSLTILSISYDKSFSILPLPRDRRLRVSGRVTTQVRALPLNHDDVGTRVVGADVRRY